MTNFIGAMGANHLEHDKLVKIVTAMEYYIPRPYNTQSAELKRVQDSYENKIYFMYDQIPYIAEQKYDGYSYLSTDGKMMSKSLSTAKDTKGQIIDKSGHIPHITSQMTNIFEQCGIDIQGEIYKPGGTSDDVTKIMGCDQDEAIFRQQRDGFNLRYMMIDLRKFRGIDVTHEPYYVRRALLDHVALQCNLWQRGSVVDVAEVINQPISAFHNIVSNGGEGLIIKKTDRIYVPGKKPEGTWIKAKKEITLDAVIMGLNSGGSGKNSDLFRSLAVGLTINGNLIYCGNVHSGIADDLRKKIYDNPNAYIGRAVELDAMDYNGKTVSLRHARFKRFRDDKMAAQCTPDGIRVKVDLI